MQKRGDSRSRRQNQLCLDIRNFKVLNLIKKGGFGSVFYVEDENTKLQYAAKVITYNNDEDKYKRMINREIGIMIHAQHPTIIKFYGYSLKDFDGFPNVVIFMEYAMHGSVTEILQNARNMHPDKKIDNTIRQIILVGVARGMMHLHSHHIIHRDLKPDNVLIDEFYRPHITDFGLSKMYEMGNSVNQSKTCGTSIYKAPEVITNNQYSEKSDVYSFAIFMYEVLTESIPYPNFLNNEMTEFNFNQKVVSDNFRPTFTKPIKRSLKALIEQCWSKNPGDRPTFEDIFSRLAFNVDYTNFNVFETNKEDENEEDSYYLDGVDIKRLLSYVDDINKTYFNTLIANSSNIIDELMKENEKIKNHLSRFEKTVTIDCFNHLPLESQQLIVSEIIKTKTNEKEIQRFTNLNNLINYLLNLLKSSGEYNFVEIPTRNSDELLIKLKEEGYLYLNRIYLLTDAIEILYNTKTLNSNEFINHLQHFDDVSVELKYPSKSFKHNYRTILNIKSSRIIRIVVFITSVVETDTAFKYDGKINCIKIDLSVTSIGDYSFDACSGINQLVFSNSLKSIGVASFHKCTSLTNVCLPNSLTVIGPHAFRECSSLVQVFVPSSVLQINEYAFAECSSLVEINIPSSVSEIREYTFAGCSSLVNLNLPSSITSIGESAFLRCSSLLNLIIPNSVVSIGIHAFEQCSSLVQISMPSSVKLIGGNAFSECSKLIQFLFQNNSQLASIDEYTFLGCSSLMQVSLPSSICSIEKCAFSACSSLNSISIPDSVTSIGVRTFEQCSALNNVWIPKSVKSIGEEAFIGCSALSQISIPSSIEKIDNLGIKDIDKINRF